MDAGTIALWIFSAIFFIITILICLALFVYISYLIQWTNKATAFVATPLTLLWKKIKQFLKKYENPQTAITLNYKFHVFGDFKGFLFFSLMGIFAIAMFLSVASKLSDGTELLLMALDNTVIGACIIAMSEQTLTDVSAPFILATGFSAGFSLFCMKPVGEGKWYIKLCMYLFSVVAMIALAMVLENVFQVVGNWGYGVMTDLFRQSGRGFFYAIWRILVLIVLGYIALLLILTVIEQYLSFIAYFPFFLITGGLISMGVEALGDMLNASRNTMQIISGSIIPFGLIIGIEVLRDNYENIRNAIKPFVNKAWKWVFKIIGMFFALIAKIFGIIFSFLG